METVLAAPRAIVNNQLLYSFQYHIRGNRQTRLVLCHYLAIRLFYTLYELVCGSDLALSSYHKRVMFWVCTDDSFFFSRYTTFHPVILKYAVSPLVKNCCWSPRLLALLHCSLQPLEGDRQFNGILMGHSSSLSFVSIQIQKMMVKLPFYCPVWFEGQEDILWMCACCYRREQRPKARSTRL